MIDDKRRQLVDNIRIALTQNSNQEQILKTAVELIDGFSEDFNWTGVYMVKNRVLEVGPYIGPKTEHTKIQFDSGICGSAAAQKKSLIVDNVLDDSRFLACSLTTRSEIVVPLMDGDKVLGEIDIDSNRLSNFNSEDQIMLEQIANLIVKRLKEVK